MNDLQINVRQFLRIYFSFLNKNFSCRYSKELSLRPFLREYKTYDIRDIAGPKWYNEPYKWANGPVPVQIHLHANFTILMGHKFCNFDGLFDVPKNP